MRILAFCIFLTTALMGQEKPFESPYISEEVWDQVMPHLLPDSHPCKKKLDRMFSTERVTASLQTLAAAGFCFPKEEGHHVAAVKHPELKGIILKIYVDAGKSECDFEKWLMRIEGANLIRQGIKELGCESSFKVPKKWIYALPPEPSPPDEPGYIRKNFILVAEDVRPLSRGKNHDKWRSKTTSEHLSVLYKLTTLYGLRDSCRVANLIWCKDKRIAFVDTEYFNQWPVNYHPLLQYLSPSKRKQWRKLTQGA